MIRVKNRKYVIYVEQVDNKYNFIDALLFSPALDIQLNNFEFWLEDAWNIVMFGCIINERVTIETEGLTDKQCGDILLWISSLYKLYSDFHNIHSENPKLLVNYIEFYQFLDEWEYYLSSGLEEKIYERINEYILSKEVTCDFELYNNKLKCFNFLCSEQGNISLPYEVLKAEIKIRENFIKRKLFSYFYNECKKHNYKSVDVTTRDALMSFMSCFHWILNYTDFNEKYFEFIIRFIEISEETIKSYLTELAKESYINFINSTDVTYIPCFNVEFTLSLMRCTKPWVLRTKLLFIKDASDTASLMDFSSDKRIKSINKIEMAYNWLRSWGSLK